MYEDLEGHFKSNHFLCVEGDCRNAKFTNAFRSQIDLKGESRLLLLLMMMMMLLFLL